jgi:hypothetical protein
MPRLEPLEHPWQGGVSDPRARNHSAQYAITQTLSEGFGHRPCGLARGDDNQAAIAKRGEVPLRCVGREQGNGIDGSNTASNNEADVVPKPGKGNAQ